MIEENENVDLVTTRRQQDLERARREYQSAVAEGRLAVRPARPEGAQLEVAAGTVPSAPDAAGAPAAEASAAEVQPVESAPADPEAAWRHTRLALTAALVVLLLVVWIWQKKGGR